jgi:hypothetical protein
VADTEVVAFTEVEVASTKEAAFALAVAAFTPADLVSAEADSVSAGSTFSDHTSTVIILAIMAVTTGTMPVAIWLLSES